MPIYYRADARSPEEIFHSGFKPRFFYQSLQDYTKLEWWRTGVRINFDPECVSEAESSNVVCMTTCFESAPIFPVDNTISTYVYIIELPDNEVYNFHNYQLQEAKDRLGVDGNSGVVAVGLCAYEAFTLLVKPENIIGVVKCERSELKPQTAGTQVYDSKYKFMIPFDRNFTVDPILILNSNFKNNNSILVNEAIENVKARLNNEYATTSIASAIDKAGLPKPTSKSLFRLHLSKGNIIEALKSVVMSVYHSIKYAFTCLYNIICKTKKSPKPTEVTHYNVTNIEPDVDNLSSFPSMLHAQPVHAARHVTEDGFNRTKQEIKDSLANISPGSDVTLNCKI